MGKLITEEIMALIEEYKAVPPAKIALLASRNPDLPLAFVAQQIKGRAKVSKKLPAWVASPDVVFPPSLNLEQCSSELTARYKASLVKAGDLGVDLTGGFGVDARFFAESFQRFRYCERDAELAEIVSNNFDAFGLSEKVELVTEDCLARLGSLVEGADFIYIDPARRDGRQYRVSAFEDCEPRILDIWDTLRAVAGVVMVKASPGLDISLALSQLSGVTAVYVVSVESECKELLFLADRDASGEPWIHCIDLSRTGEATQFSFCQSDEATLPGEVGIPGRYLFEPNASIMKAGGFKSVSAQLGLKALNPRTRLYCLDVPRDNLPGKVFEILGKGSLNAKDCKRLFPERKANVVSRNSGMSAEELKKKLKLKDGGDLYAIGATVSDVGRQLFACRLLNQI